MELLYHMQNQKLENLLNLALEATPAERAGSQELETGFNPEEKTWELIVKYSGSLDQVRALGVTVEEMRNEYAILTVPEGLIEQISAFPQIEYIEKPKRLFFAVNRARAASCINVLQEPPVNLTGRGVLIAVLDSGIDYFHEDFRQEDGRTRIAVLWDQTSGRIYTREEIDEAIETGSRTQARRLVSSTDSSSHGTAVAGIAAGNGREGEGAYRGIAYESELLVVKLGTASAEGFPRTTELMRAVNFAVTYAVERNLPLVINISFGNTYGSHDGSSLLETFLNDISNYGRTTMIVGSGNEGAVSGHISGVLPNNGNRETQIELSVAPYETGLSVQLWKEYSDRFQIRLRTPSGEELGPLSEELGPVRFQYRGMQLLVYHGKPSPYSKAQEIYFDFIPEPGEYVASGIWSFLLRPQRIIQGRYDLWLPSASVLNTATRFLSSTPDTTLTIPSAAENVITVGAYNSVTGAYADFSGRGFTRLNEMIKPDVVAPGVALMAPAPGGGYRSVTGTSFAAPVAAGSAALLMQWGITDGNDPFLYGEKVKAYFRRGARQLAGYAEYPNEQVGFGALCVAESIPV